MANWLGHGLPYAPWQGATIPCKARLAMNSDKLTEPAIITLIEHYLYEPLPCSF